MQDKNGIEMQVGDRVYHVINGIGTVVYRSSSSYVLECDKLGEVFIGYKSHAVEVISRAIGQLTLYEIKEQATKEINKLLNKYAVMSNAEGAYFSVSISDYDITTLNQSAPKQLFNADVALTIK